MGVLRIFQRKQESLEVYLSRKQKHIYDDGKIVLVKGYLPKSRNRIQTDC